MSGSGSGKARRGPERRLGLTPARIIDAARELSHGRGLNSWTIRDLAAALDVAPSVIYHHVGGRDRIVRGVVERLLGELRPPSAELPWQEWFRTFFYSARPLFAPYPGVAKWLVMHGPTFPGIEAFLDAGISTLDRAGFPRPALVYAMLTNSAMLSITRNDDRLEAGDDGPRDHATMRRLFSGIGADSPGIGRMITEVLGPLSDDPEGGGEAIDAEYYRLLVESLIAGLETLLPTER
ncbi:TetR/AcrR family transcriptional regulator [Mycetocola reblochoni]|nr:TetR/AcrR family transcriptional regulator [Mycetocola reblochoni]RLP67935.1 TetR/AcrR family transcriptional regulator [Mycetocola reblochoni]